MKPMTDKIKHGIIFTPLQKNFWEAQDHLLDFRFFVSLDFPEFAYFPRFFINKGEIFQYFSQKWEPRCSVVVYEHFKFISGHIQTFWRERGTISGWTTERVRSVRLPVSPPHCIFISSVYDRCNNDCVCDLCCSVCVI